MAGAAEEPGIAKVSCEEAAGTCGGGSPSFTPQTEHAILKTIAAFMSRIGFAPVSFQSFKIDWCMSADSMDSNCGGAGGLTSNPNISKYREIASLSSPTQMQISVTDLSRLCVRMSAAVGSMLRMEASKETRVERVTRLYFSTKMDIQVRRVWVVT